MTMKILALGGSGDMGQTAVKTILQHREVDQLIVADCDLDRMNTFVESLNDERVSARAIDVQDAEALEGLMRQVDVVMNTVGPFYRFGVPIVRAAIKTGRNYADINDDYRPTQEVLELDEEAREVGITVLVGIGASPGITNILARHAAEQLDEVDHIQTVWGSVGGVRRAQSAVLQESVLEARRVEAALVHFMYCASWKIPVFRDGKFVEIVPVEDGEEVTFPNGKGFFYYIGHPEPVTLARFVKGISGACNLCGVGPEAYDALRELGARVRAGALSEEQAAAVYPNEVLRRMQQRLEEPQDMGPRVGGLHASASGRKDGKRVRYGYGLTTAPPGGMAGVTGVPLAIAVEMIMNGEISQRGVLAPEACIEPLPFFERYMQYCESPPESVEQAVYQVVEEI